jgi:hypothetical protein
MRQRALTLSRASNLMVLVKNRSSTASDRWVDLGSLGSGSRNASYRVSICAPCRSGDGLSVAAPVRPLSQPDKMGAAAMSFGGIAASIFPVQTIDLLLTCNIDDVYAIIRRGLC